MPQHASTAGQKQPAFVFGDQRPQQTAHQPSAGSVTAQGQPCQSSAQVPSISLGSQNRPPQNRRSRVHHARSRPITPAAKAAKAQWSTADSLEAQGSSTARSQKAVPIDSKPTCESPHPGVPYSPLPHCWSHACSAPLRVSVLSQRHFAAMPSRGGPLHACLTVLARHLSRLTKGHSGSSPGDRGAQETLPSALWDVWVLLIAANVSCHSS